MNPCSQHCLQAENWPLWTQRWGNSGRYGVEKPGQWERRPGPEAGALPQLWLLDMQWLCMSSIDQIFPIFSPPESPYPDFHVKPNFEVKPNKSIFENQWVNRTCLQVIQAHTRCQKPTALQGAGEGWGWGRRTDACLYRWWTFSSTPPLLSPSFPTWSVCPHSEREMDWACLCFYIKKLNMYVYQLSFLSYFREK